MNKLLIVMILILSFSCSTKKVTTQPMIEKSVNQSIPESDTEEKYGKLLQEGANKLTSRYTKESGK